MSLSKFSNLKISLVTVFLIDLISYPCFDSWQKQVTFSKKTWELATVLSEFSFSGLERPVFKCFLHRTILLRCFEIMQDFKMCLYAKMSQYFITYPTPLVEPYQHQAKPNGHQSRDKCCELIDPSQNMSLLILGFWSCNSLFLCSEAAYLGILSFHSKVHNFTE